MYFCCCLPCYPLTVATSRRRNIASKSDHERSVVAASPLRSGESQRTIKRELSLGSEQKKWLCCAVQCTMEGCCGRPEQQS